MINVKRTKTSILSVAFKGILCNREGKHARNEEIAEIHKKNKKYVPVTDDEKLIDVPEHWVWTRLGYVTENHGQTTPTETFSYIDVGTMDNVNQRLSKHENLVEAKDAPSRAKKIVEKGDVLYSTVRPYLHNICIVDKDFTKKPIASTAFCVMAANEKVLNNRFLFYWLLTAEFDRFSNGNPSKGTLYPAIGEKDLLNGVIPLPPLKEQKEIVEIIEDAFNALGQLDVAQSQYASDLEALKSKLIGAAICGKLTQQLPEDGDAEDLYNQVQDEKARLIKEGKFKKEKPLPEIAERELPFEIPKNWKWVRWGNVINIVSARRVHQSDWRNEGIPFYRAREIARLADKGTVNNDLFISEDLYNEFSKSGIPQCGDLMVTGVGTLGKAYVVKENDKFYYKDASVLCFENYAGLDALFLKKLMESDLMQTQINSNSGGTTVDTLTMVRMNQYLMPLPPLSEQRRIVERLEAIMEQL